MVAFDFLLVFYGLGRTLSSYTLKRSSITTIMYNGSLLLTSDCLYGYLVCMFFIVTFYYFLYVSLSLSLSLSFSLVCLVCFMCLCIFFLFLSLTMDHVSEIKT